MAKLAHYRFTLKYRPGTANRDAAFLSCRSRPIEEIIQIIPMTIYVVKGRKGPDSPVYMVEPLQRTGR